MSAENKPTPVELELSDAFHRIKRTVMLLSGSLVVLGSTTGLAEAIDAVKGAAGLEGASPIMLRAALFAAATYYFWGFVHQFWAAHRSNADLMDASKLASYEVQVRSVAQALQDHSEALDANQKDFAELVSALPDRLNDAFLDVADPSRGEALMAGHYENFSSQTAIRRNHPDPAIRQGVDEEFAAMVADQQNKFRMAALEKIAGVSRDLDRVEASQNALNRHSKDLQTYALRAADRIRLNKRMYRDRWFSFWIWEGVSTVVVYGLALAFTFTTIGFSLANWLVRVATV
ncbi:hypothetical protein [Brevundimonas sp. Root1279]|uniref:hypothetical protein n=1 Tax=Brevundimonas sp. Root1279 TaxID=1736443 RepID=UPI0006F74C51|nr:hypothetical protein [Brevundimonas sp. Root1279]KQW82514.1 hypothetical protein ASC65_09835 [Brevundimonas sp. Root1279]